eukprot:4775380-Alexandrium_andersonii.AAC.1
MRARVQACMRACALMHSCIRAGLYVCVCARDGRSGYAVAQSPALFYWVLAHASGRIPLAVGRPKFFSCGSIE